MDEPYLQLDGDVVAWLDGNAKVRLAWAGPDGKFGVGGDDCQALIASTTGLVFRLRVGGNRVVWDESGVGVFVYEPTTANVCGPGTVTNVTAPIASAQFSFFNNADLEGNRLVVVAGGQGVHLLMIDPGPDGLYSSTANNVVTNVVPFIGGAQDLIISGDQVAFIFQNGGPPDVRVLSLVDGNEQSVSRHPGNYTQLGFDKGRVVWSDTRLGGFDTWMFEP